MADSEVTGGNKRLKTEEAGAEHAMSQAEASDHCAINTLNDDCLIRIFECLTDVERVTIETVCKRWRDVAELAWTNVKELNFTYPDLQRKLGLPAYKHEYYVMRLMKNSGRYLKKLSVGVPLCDRILPYIGQHCYNLTSLTLSLPYFNNSYTFLSQLRELKEFTLNNIRSELPGEILEALPIGSLTKIAFSGSTDYVSLPAVASRVFANLKNLKSLTLHRLHVQSDIMILIGQMTNLTYLAFEICKIRNNLSHIQKLINLEHLVLKDGPMYGINDSLLEHIANNCLNMKKIQFIECGTFSDIGIRHLLNLTKLEVLELIMPSHEITDESLSRFHNLKKLNCEGCFNVTDSGMISLIKSANNLEFLNVVNTKVSEKLLIEAAEITKKRTNDLQLRIFINDNIKDKWQQKMNFSHLLVVTGIVTDRSSENDSESDDIVERYDGYEDSDEYADYGYDFDDYREYWF